MVEDRVIPEAVLLDDNCQNGERSDIKVEKGMTKTTRDGNERERNSTDVCGFEDSSPDSEIAAPPNRPRRAGYVESNQSTNFSVVETVQSIAEQVSDDEKI